MKFKWKLWWKRAKKRRSQKKENRVKNAAGNSTCYHCGGAWNWKESATIFYYQGRGMFPLCQNCFDELSKKQILYYCKKKWDKDLRRARYGLYTDAQKNLGSKQFLKRCLQNIKRKKQDKKQKYRQDKIVEGMLELEADNQ